MVYCLFLLSLILEISDLIFSNWVLFLIYFNLFEIKVFVVVVGLLLILCMQVVRSHLLEYEK
jgi:hypothetical protein